MPTYSTYSTTITRNAKDASKLLKAISNPNRLMILSQLKLLKRQNVTQLLSNLSISQPALSQHLAVMKQEGLITSTKKGTTIYYAIDKQVVNDILNSLECYFETN